MRPVSAEHRVTQGFGEGATAGVAANPDPRSGVGYLVWLYGNYQPFGHAGGDVGCEVGTPVRAARSGTVVWAGWDVDLPGNDSWGPGGYFDRWGFYKRFGGRIIVVQYAPGDLDAYAHLSEFKVKRGQWVTEGDLIGLSGDSSGGQDGVLGPHLHTERIVDLTYSTGAGRIYGRIDPTTVWGGVTPQGTITPLSEEDEMPTPEDLWKHKLTLDGKEFEAGDILVYARKNAEGAKNNAETAAVKSTAALTAAQAAPGLAVQVLLATKLPAPDGSGKAYTIADYLIFGWWYAMQAKDKPQGPPMDLAALNKAIQESVANIVPDLQITVKETPNG